MFGAGRAGEEREGRWGSRWAGERRARGRGQGWVVMVSRTVLCLPPTESEGKSSMSVLVIIVRDQILMRDREVRENGEGRDEQRKTHQHDSDQSLWEIRLNFL